MAEGGDYFGYDDPNLDHDIDHEDDNDEQEINTTGRFQPGSASTPYHGGEQHEMQTMQHEQSGLQDTSYLETPLLGDLIDPKVKKYHVGKAFEYIKNRFPRVDLKKWPNWFWQKTEHTRRHRFVRAKRWRDPDFQKRQQWVSKKLHRQIQKYSWAKR